MRYQMLAPIQPKLSQAITDPTQSPEVQRLPSRPSMVDQTVDLMRDLIITRRWKDFLPGEETLRKEFGISRVTLRKALVELVVQGWITPGGRGQRTAIAQARQSPTLTQIGGGVEWITEFPPLEHAWNTRIIADEIRKALLIRDRKLEVYQHKNLWVRDPTPQLARITAGSDTTGWILHRASPEIQRWFQKSHLHCVVLGPCHEGINLPSVALDYSALGHHLAAEATRLGHHHIAYITFDVVAASSQNTLHGLRQFTPKDGRTAQLTIIHDDVSLDVLRSAIHAAMAQDSPPTLILVTEAVQALPVIGILKEMNLRIPEDVSLVVRDHEPCLERSVPEITRYNFDWLRFGRTVARLLSTMIESGGVKVIPRKLLPVFVPGRTLTRRRSV